MEGKNTSENHSVENLKDATRSYNYVPSDEKLIKFIVEHFGDTERCADILRIFDKDDLDKALADIHKSRKTPIIDSILYAESK